MKNIDAIRKQWRERRRKWLSNPENAEKDRRSSRHRMRRIRKDRKEAPI